MEKQRLYEPKYFDVNSWESCQDVLNAIRAKWPHIEIAVYYDERHPEHTEEAKKDESDI